MKNIQTLSKQVAKLQTELDRADAAKARCVTAIEAAEVRATELRDLQEQRTSIVAQAFADDEKPDTAKLDAEIDRAEKTQGDGGAADALPLLETQCVELKDALATAREELKDAVVADLATRRAKAMESFNAAIEATREPLAQLVALHGMDRRLRGVYSPWTFFDLVKEAGGVWIFGERGMHAPQWYAETQRSGDGFRALADELRGLGLEI